MQTTIRLHRGDLGKRQILVRCDLTNPQAIVEADLNEGKQQRFKPTKYLCPKEQTTISLVVLAHDIAAEAVNMPAHKLSCSYCTISEPS